jgi:hypothetical protein
MKFVSVGVPCDFIGFTFLLGIVTGVAQKRGVIAMGGFVQWELLVTMKLLPCHSPEIGRACRGNEFRCRFGCRFGCRYRLTFWSRLRCRLTRGLGRRFGVRLRCRFWCRFRRGLVCRSSVHV